MYFHRTAAALGTLVAAAWIMPAWAGDAPSDTVYLFSFFRGNGETGLYLASSEDGLHWTALNNDRPLLKPEVGSKLMRDPSIVRGPDGMFHMVWTTGWWDKGIGVAHSKDMVEWSEQTFLPVMQHEPTAKNCWAPELYFDAATGTYLICWATTIPGRFPETEHPKDDNNQRMYYVATKDFRTYTDTALFYDPGFNVIDTFIVKDAENGRYAMFLKNETRHPAAEKNIRVAFSEKAAGPYGPVSEPIHGNYWAEGPSALRVGDRWIVYFDRYTEGRYGAAASRDLKHWEDISDRVQFPRGARHGTAFEVERAVVEHIEAATAP